MITQFKTLEDISELIKEYETILMRPTLKLSHPTLYRKRDAGKKEHIIKGVRVKDWFYLRIINGLSLTIKWAFHFQRRLKT